MRDTIILTEQFLLSHYVYAKNFSVYGRFRYFLYQNRLQNLMQHKQILFFKFILYVSYTKPFDSYNLHFCAS